MGEIYISIYKLYKYIAPYYFGNPNIGPRIVGNLDQYPYSKLVHVSPSCGLLFESELNMAADM